MPVTGKPGDLCRSVFGTWFLGIPMVQWWADMVIWEKLFNERHFKRVIELGHGRGAMSMYLLLQSIQHEAEYIGYDHVGPQAGPTPIGKLLKLNERCSLGDLWSDLRTGEIRAQMADPANHPLLLFCDNGDKPREFKLFAPMMRAGDVVAVHDFGNEFSDADIHPDMAKRLSRLYAAECDNMPGGVLTRWWEFVA